MPVNFNPNENLYLLEYLRNNNPKGSVNPASNPNAPKIKEQPDYDSFNYSKNDGYIPFSEKLVNFGKGVISPVTYMLSSVSNFVKGSAAIAGGALLIKATKGAAAPVLAAAGLGIGAFQIGKGAYNAAFAKTDDEAGNAWQNMGAGAAAIGLSAAGAKTALKTAGIENADKMSISEASIECIKQTPAMLGKTFNALTSSECLVNLGLKAAPNTETPPEAKPQEKVNLEKTPEQIAAKNEHFKKKIKQAEIKSEAANRTIAEKRAQQAQNLEDAYIEKNLSHKSAKESAEVSDPVYRYQKELAGRCVDAAKQRNSAAGASSAADNSAFKSRLGKTAMQRAQEAKGALADSYQTSKARVSQLAGLKKEQLAALDDLTVQMLVNSPNSSAALKPMQDLYILKGLNPEEILNIQTPHNIGGREILAKLMNGSYSTSAEKHALIEQLNAAAGRKV